MYGPRMKWGPIRDGEDEMDEHTLDQLDGVTLAGGSDREVVARLFGFAVVLRAAGLMPPDEDEYWERPWKWDVEYRTWIAHGQPSPGDWLTDRFAEFAAAAAEEVSS